MDVKVGTMTLKSCNVSDLKVENTVRAVENNYKDCQIIINITDSAVKQFRSSRKRKRYSDEKKENKSRKRQKLDVEAADLSTKRLQATTHSISSATNCLIQSNEALQSNESIDGLVDETLLSLVSDQCPLRYQLATDSDHDAHSDIEQEINEKRVLSDNGISSDEEEDQANYGRNFVYKM